MKESKYQLHIVRKLRDLFPDCVIFKNDSSYTQGVPDLTILYNDRWAMLEVKTSHKASQQPNQKYYVQKFADMSFAAFISPENEDEVLDELQRSFGTIR